jgi:hypothetical protein
MGVMKSLYPGYHEKDADLVRANMGWNDDVKR